MKSDEPEGDADLRSGNRSSESMTGSEFFKRDLKTMFVGNVKGIGNAADRFGYAAKTRITQKQNIGPDTFLR